MPSIVLNSGFEWKELVEYCKDSHRGPACMKISDKLVRRKWLPTSTPQ